MEHFKGAFPTWMSPIQVMIVPVSVDKFGDYAEKLASVLRNDLYRAQADLGDDTFNKKIRAAVTAKVPNILVVGAKEMEEETVTWRRYSVKEQRTLKFAQFQAILDKMYRQRVMDNFADTALPEA